MNINKFPGYINSDFGAFDIKTIEIMHSHLCGRHARLLLGFGLTNKTELIIDHSRRASCSLNTGMGWLLIWWDGFTDSLIFPGGLQVLKLLQPHKEQGNRTEKKKHDYSSNSIHLLS